MSATWYKTIPTLDQKKSKSVIHPFIVRDYSGLTINPYQGCQHRCAYCYATYQWSPEFYDRIYAKINAPELLERELANWKSPTIGPVMISSATDCYQPAEIRFGLTRKCIQVLQKYNAPYYIFTKSSLIERDIEFHRRYKDNCFIVWSITTSNEKIRRVIEPGTPTTARIFSTIKKFTGSGVHCGVNIDPIMPLLTDSKEEIYELIERCREAGVRYVFGSIMRLRDDIWDRMKIALRLLEVPDGKERYKHIYHFEEPIGSSYVSVDKRYADQILENLEEKAAECGMLDSFPEHMVSKAIDKSHLGQTTLVSYLA